MTRRLLAVERVPTPGCGLVADVRCAAVRCITACRAYAPTVAALFFYDEVFISPLYERMSARGAHDAVQVCGLGRSKQLLRWALSPPSSPPGGQKAPFPSLLPPLSSSAVLEVFSAASFVLAAMLALDAGECREICLFLLTCLQYLGVESSPGSGARAPACPWCTACCECTSTRHSYRPWA